MFSQRTLDFLYFNFKNNSREWYRDHKEDYLKYVQEPLYDMISEMAPTMQKIDPAFVTDPKQITSRIYRDMRFNPEGYFYRDHMWFCFQRPGKVYNGPQAFFFEVSPYKLTFGCGYYQASSDSMKKWRELIYSSSPQFQKAFEAFKKQKVFTLEGESLKTIKYPHENKEIEEWLNKKTVCLIAYSKDIDLFTSDKLPSYIADCFMKIKPIYDFMCSCEIRTN
ncbi:MAG: DUF2461 domain-containing protein [Clostridia bacterium]|nr:DUF2461 domain-containing protein [Clostridia bacterium]